MNIKQCRRKYERARNEYLGWACFWCLFAAMLLTAYVYPEESGLLAVSWIFDPPREDWLRTHSFDYHAPEPEASQWYRHFSYIIVEE